MGDSHTPVEDFVEDLAGPFLGLPDGPLGPFRLVVVRWELDVQHDERVEHLQPLVECRGVHDDRRDHILVQVGWPFSIRSNNQTSTER